MAEQRPWRPQADITVNEDGTAVVRVLVDGVDITHEAESVTTPDGRALPVRPTQQ